MSTICKAGFILFLTGIFMGFNTDPVKKDKKPLRGKEVVLSLEPGPDNPRNSEGDFITLKDGRILFVYSHYTGGDGNDHAPAFLAGRYSRDGGKTWTTTDKVILEKEGLMNSMSVSLLRLKNGTIALFYLKKNSEEDCIPMMRTSTDETATWSDPIPCITDRKGYYVLNNNRVIQLKNGRLLLSVSLHRTAGEKEWFNGGRVFSYYSDNNGKTWLPGGEVPNPDKVVMQEPGLIALKDGSIFMFIRTDAGSQYASYSKDQGKTWSAAVKSNIKSPLSPASIARIPATGDLLLVWNNNDGSNPAIKDRRTPMNIAVSKDEGKTWQQVKAVEDDSNGWYCYFAIHFVGKQVLVGHCAGSGDDGLAVTHITRLSLDWIYQ